jgi:hypothetical protein
MGKMNIIGITGLAGSGKDTAAAVLVARFGFVKVSLADEIKRICARVFHWTPERLWGPSERRNEPDPSLGGLTARHALQQLGTEWGRAMHPDVWVNRVISDARRIAIEPVFYNPEKGLVDWFGRDGRDIYRSVVIPDVRFLNEAAAITAVGGRIWRIDRPGAGLAGEAGKHSSEASIYDLPVNGALSNDGSLEDFERDVVAFAGIYGFKAVPR